MAHQHLDAEAHGIRRGGGEIAVDASAESGEIFLHSLGAQRVAGRPVVDIRQKGVDGGERVLIAGKAVDQQRVQVVLVEIAVRQRGKKSRGLVRSSQLLCQRAERRHPHAEDRLGLDARQQAREKTGVALIRESLKALPYRHFTFPKRRSRR